jgi:diguanylate cyclase (GGDEF)-like protein
MKRKKMSRPELVELEEGRSRLGTYERNTPPQPERSQVPPIGGVEGMEMMFRQLAAGSGSEQAEAGPRTWKYEPLWQLSMSDPHTGLVNQLLLHDRLSNALSRRQRHGGQVIVIHIALTNLSQIHSELGYTVGNDVIWEVSRRLTSHLRNEDTVGRVGGSELVAVMTVDDERAAEILHERLETELKGPFIVSNRSVHVSAALGMALAKNAESAEEVLARADRAA